MLTVIAFLQSPQSVRLDFCSPSAFSLHFTVFRGMFFSSLFDKRLNSDRLNAPNSRDEPENLAKNQFQIVS